MRKRNSILSVFSGESGVFIILWLVYLVMPYLVIPERYNYSMGFPEVVIKSAYLLPILLNNYVFIPRFLHKGKYTRYILLFLGILIAATLVEELILENIFYPTTRGGGLTFNGFRHAAFKISFAIVFFGSFKIVWDYQRKQKQVGELEKQKVESELKFLKSQINPHVLFNNLNNIYSYSLEKSDKVPEMLLKLSEIMRYMLQDGTEQLVPLQKELRYLANFIELQKIRLEDRGEVIFDVQGSPGTMCIAPLLLVSFVENSFKHSMQSEVDDIRIYIRAIIEGDTLIFDTENTYSAEHQSLSNNGESGIGLQNVRKRLGLMYKDRHSLEITKEDQTFIVRLTLNLHEDEPEMSDY